MTASVSSIDDILIGVFLTASLLFIIIWSIMLLKWRKKYLYKIFPCVPNRYFNFLVLFRLFFDRFKANSFSVFISTRFGFFNFLHNSKLLKYKYFSCFRLKFSISTLKNRLYMRLII